MTPQTKQFIEKFEKCFERCLNEYWFKLTPLEKERYLASFTTDLDSLWRERFKKELKKWIFENHHHHGFADEKLPDNCQGCEDRNWPYVNSVAL